jgi:hypothetical protein
MCVSYMHSTSAKKENNFTLYIQKYYIMIFLTNLLVKCWSFKNKDHDIMIFWMYMVLFYVLSPLLSWILFLIWEISFFFLPPPLYSGRINKILNAILFLYMSYLLYHKSNLFNFDKIYIKLTFVLSYMVYQNIFHDGFNEKMVL